jgi:TolB-like protein
MKRRQSPPPDASAAEWYVALDATSPEEIGDARFASWLDRDSDNEPDLERCEAAVEIARRLADDPDLRWAYDEAAALALGGRELRGAGRSRRFRWPRLAWGVAALALAAVVAALIAREAREPIGNARALDIANVSKPSSSAAGIVALSSASNPVIVLPGRVAVDANSVAVLPFLEQPGDAPPRANVAAELNRDLVTALRAVPGLYAIGEPSVSPYAASELQASEIGALLGARAVLSADVALVKDDILVTARLADAATDTILWEARYAQPLAQLPAIRVAILDGVAGALVDPELRARSARGFTQAKAPNVLATTLADAAFQ